MMSAARLLKFGACFKMQLPYFVRKIAMSSGSHLRRPEKAFGNIQLAASRHQRTDG